MIHPLSYVYNLRYYVNEYASFLGRRFVSIIWIVALCVAIWFYGYLLAIGSFKPLEPALNRVIAIALVVLGWGGWLVWTTIKKRRAEKAIIDDLAADGQSSPDAEARAEIETLRTRLKEAMGLLRRAGKRRFGYVYELPWYLIIGAPGSGKTTSLVQSGLKFPLGETLGAEPVKGVGGTRNCNWWFAEDAILIDTAGRYTTHGEFAGANKAGWNGFLALLRKHRPSEPINGALITLSIPDLLERDSEARLEEIRQIRQRLAEMDETLRARVPIYVVLTKADLLEGFVPFFDGLSRTGRDQVWGTTFPFELSQNPKDLPERFLEEFDLLLGRVDGLLLERMQQEPDIETRGRIFQLPAQMTMLREPMREVLAELSSQSKLVAPPLLRGVYITSSTQVGEARTPARSMRRSYFLLRLFSNVIFEEAALVARDGRLTKRALLLRRAAIGAVAVFGAFVSFGWIGAYFHNISAIAHAEKQVNHFKASSEGIPVRNVADEDFLRILPSLDELADATAKFHERPLLGINFGLSQEDKVAGIHRYTYGTALNALLLPRLMVHLQNKLLNEKAGVDETFDALKLYGMLGGLGPMKPEEAVASSRFIFEELYPGEGRRVMRNSLVAHVAALVGRPLAPLTTVDWLVAAARQRIKGQSLQARAFHVLSSSLQATALPAWSVSSVVGSSREVAFQRRSGGDLRDGVPGLYTRNGFLSVVAKDLPDVARSVAGEYWVRGQETETVPPSDIARETLRLYFSEYEKRWRTYLADVTVHQSETLPAMADTVGILANQQQPLVQLARSVAETTDLSGALASGSLSRAAALLPIEPGSVPDPYAALRTALSEKAAGDKPEAGSKVEAIQPLIKTLHEQLSRASLSSEEVVKIFDVKGTLAAANQALVGEARRLPAPLGDWVAGLSAAVDLLAVNTARASMQSAWQAEGARVCAAAIAGRYPFDRKAEREVAMDDFVRVFGPKGVFETFFGDKLAPFVDTTTNPWRWKGAFGAEGRASEALAQFGRAHQIRQAFFSNSDQPSIRITITPESLDQDSNAVMLEVQGERIVYVPGRVLPKTIMWPAREKVSLSRLAFLPGGLDEAISKSGPWSTMRLFDVAEKKPLSDDRFQAVFTHGGHSATFQIQVGSILNPFTTNVLNTFRCPDKL